MIHFPIFTRQLFKLTEDLRSRLKEAIAQPMNAVTYVSSMALLEDVMTYTKPHYANGMGIEYDDMVLSDTLSTMCGTYETQLQAALMGFKTYELTVKIQVQDQSEDEVESGMQGALFNLVGNDILAFTIDDVTLLTKG